MCSSDLAGFRILNEMFGRQVLRGGDPQEIVAAGGEYVISPESVALKAGDGDLERGHSVLDDFVKKYRALTIKTLKELPGPRRD